MDLERIKEIIQILSFICKRKSTTIPDIKLNISLEKFQSEKTLYRHIDRWVKDGYIIREDLSGKRFNLLFTQKLRDFLSSLKTILTKEDQE